MAMGKFTHSAWGRFTQCVKLSHRHFFVRTGTSGTCITKSFPTPGDVSPFQKAGPRKRSNRGRKERQTSIHTDTPVKNALQIEKEKSIMRNLASTHHTMSQSENSTRTRYNNEKQR
ncbi:hypothetical protein AVEN_269442-1 [Araneus ventricosus]|uniref:Uncharacterized protein n=1 Tax=Araneus ventricosus TaxID=182803 RepID=A0A4Y2T050_ARAVE|nr:hypothetical protein AVEN_269442-1 [Araneus ventricosus]